jgi:hypothetical protein
MKNQVALALVLCAVSFAAVAAPTAEFSCPADDDDKNTDRCTFRIYSADGLSSGGTTVDEGASRREAVSGPNDEFCMSRVGAPDDDTCERQALVNYED